MEKKIVTTILSRVKGPGDLVRNGKGHGHFSGSGGRSK